MSASNLRWRRVAVALGLTAAAALAHAQAGATPGSAAPAGSGPHPALMESPAGLPTHTLYRPRDLAALGAARLPLVVWGNGACVNIGNRFRPFLTEIASHGFAVLALGPIVDLGTAAVGDPAGMPSTPASGSPAARAAAQGALPARISGGNRPSDTTPAQMIEAIDWAIAENRRSGSPLAGRIDTAQIAVMGQSCGGLQAIDAARDARVKTLGVWNSGLFTDDQRAWVIAAANVTKASLKTLHTPVIYVTGEPSEVAFDNADDDFARIDHLPVVRAWREGTGHAGTYREINGGAYAPVAVAWLRWQLKGDPEAASMFRGERCGLCVDPKWHMKTKRID